MVINGLIVVNIIANKEHFKCLEPKNYKAIELIRIRFIKCKGCKLKKECINFAEDHHYRRKTNAYSYG